MPRTDLVQFRRGTAAAWTSANPTLAAGELGFETDTGQIKIGDGSTAWASLEYFYPGVPDLTVDIIPTASVDIPTGKSQIVAGPQTFSGTVTLTVNGTGIYTVVS